MLIVLFWYLHPYTQCHFFAMRHIRELFRHIFESYF
nr:MAG TPA_asm: hypothetical protein [Caudoviricetes sp.]